MDGLVGAEVMQRERKEHDVEGLVFTKLVNIRTVILNFRKVGTQLAGDLDGRRLEIHRVDCHRRVGCTSELDNQPRDVSRAGCQIENTQPVAALYPARQKIADQSIAAEVAVKRAQIPQTSFYLVRPDGYVGLCGSRLEAGVLERYFAERVGIHS